MSDEHSTSRTKRMAVRFTDDDLAFLAEHAEDEGVEPATLVRMIVSRLRKGRQPLISMMAQGPHAGPPPVDIDFTRPGQPLRQFVVTQGAEPSQPSLDPGVADDVLNSRLAEIETADVVPLRREAPQEEVAAIPLVRVPRTQYNPGRN